jgi:DNA ligase-1
MLAASIGDTSILRYPLLASTKLDGIRAFVEKGVVLSRNRKPIPNIYIQEMFKHLEFHDGELVTGPPNSPDVYRRTMSCVMSQDVLPQGTNFMVFDHLQYPDLPYTERLQCVHEEWRLSQTLINSELELLNLEEVALRAGYEGIMLRKPDSPYKYGRSTLSQGYLMKLKRFSDSEGTVVGFEELMHNGNVAKINELGFQSRSSHQANLVPMGRLGALIVEWEGKLFNIGTGFTDAERIDIWNRKEQYHGKQAKFKYLPVGVKDLPRHPVFLGWRLD